MSDHFRRCSAVVLLRSAEIGAGGDSAAFQILLVHKPRKNDAWQLPQGGREEGESVEEAALRELHEETGLDAHVLGLSKMVYQYEFPSSYRRFRPDNVCGQRVEFVFAKPFDDPIVTVDGNEIDGYVWAVPEQIGQYLKRKEYRKIVEGLVREGITLLERE